MKKITPNVFGGYYLVPKADEKRIFRVEPLHCYSCGFVSDNELLYIFWNIDLLPDTLGKRQECFDFSALDGDVIAASPLIQLAMSGAEVSLSDAPSLLSAFVPSTQQRIVEDLQAGLTPYEIMYKRLGIMVDQYVGETWGEVMMLHPDWLVKTVTTDDDGNEVVTYNLVEPKFRGWR